MSYCNIFWIFHAKSEKIELFFFDSWTDKNMSKTQCVLNTFFYFSIHTSHTIHCCNCYQDHISANIQR